MATYFGQFEKDFASISEACKEISTLHEGMKIFFGVHDLDELIEAAASTNTSRFGWLDEDEYSLVWHSPDGEYSLYIGGTTDSEEVQVTLSLYFYAWYYSHARGGYVRHCHLGEEVVLDDRWYRSVDIIEYWEEQSDPLCATQEFQKSRDIRDLQLALDWDYDGSGCRNFYAALDPIPAMAAVEYLDPAAVMLAAEAELRREYSFRHVPEADRPFLRACVAEYRNALRSLITYCEE